MTAKTSSPPLSIAGNIEVIKGLPSNKGDQFSSDAAVLSSPFFPAMYPRDFIKEHRIQCTTDESNVSAATASTHNNNLIDSCRIRVIFTDFQVAFVSTIEVRICALPIYISSVYWNRSLLNICMHNRFSIGTINRLMFIREQFFDRP